MSETVDARGLSCPQPVLMALDVIKQQSTGEIVVLVDTEASRENVTRAAVSEGWSVSEQKQDEDSFQLTLTKG